MTISGIHYAHYGNLFPKRDLFKREYPNQTANNS